MPSKISDFDRNNVGAILRGSGDWFSAKLLRLIAACDSDNLETLRSVYFDHVEAYELWLTRGEPRDPDISLRFVPEERGHNPEAYS